MTEDARRRRILDARTAELSGRQPLQTDAPGQGACAVSVGGEVFAIPIDRVRAVIEPMRVVPLPGGHPLVSGLGHAWGRFHAVVELAALLGLSPAERKAGEGHVVILRHEPPVALTVERVLGTGTAVPISPDDPLSVRLPGLADAAALVDLEALLAPLFIPASPGA
ncbi:chemotaxis protein CheW [Chthonobacter albigriseus]|uniref:chemotaxis protein CheW n=1 Tax=Chthonobacter albigriseus TaxID=1683161 RepID=UPI0015EEC584|nr:chemotaxis protein CheW [Chthonobacter albigriseus]